VIVDLGGREFVDLGFELVQSGCEHKNDLRVVQETFREVVNGFILRSLCKSGKILNNLMSVSESR
jgi:hypothetical protein